MRNLTATFCVIIAVLIGSAGVSWGADFDKGVAAADRGDYATALREFTPLAEQGDAYAQFNLGLMYEQGRGVPQDDKTAAGWWTLAAEQGIAEAQQNLGVMYYEGRGVPQDYVYAHMWVNLAASNGNEGAMKVRDIVAERMTPADISAAQKLARECVQKNYKGC